MDLTVSLIFYLVIGAAVSLAVWLADNGPSNVLRMFRVTSAVFFWPLYVPILLQSGPVVSQANDAGGRSRIEPPKDAIGKAISRVEHELDAALESLDGWPGSIMAHQHERFAELKAAWNVQAGRIRELDELLGQSEFVEASSEQSVLALDSADASDYVRRSESMRQQNIDRLCALRTRMHDDLMGTLAWVRELVTMIHLARYTGAPAKRAEELVTQIAAAVEGLSEVTDWQERPTDLLSRPVAVGDSTSVQEKRNLPPIPSRTA